MGLPEPTGALWTEVKAHYDPWPPDDENAAIELGAAWRQAATTARTAAERSVAAGGNALAAWPDQAGELFDGTVRRFGAQVGALEQGMVRHGGAAERYGEQLRSVKQTIESVISTYQPYYDLLSNPVFGEAGRAMRDWLVRNVAGRLADLVRGAADRLGLRLSASGPEVGTEVTGPQGLGPGEVGAFANLFKVEAENADGTVEGEAGLDAAASAGAELSAAGLQAKLEASLGLKASLAGETRLGPGELVGVEGEADGLVGAEAGAELNLGKDGVEAEVTAFAGARGGIEGGIDVGGIGFTAGAEGWVGPGAEAGLTFGPDENGVWHLGASAGASPLVGGKLSAGISIDPERVAETASQISRTAQDGAEAVGRGIESARAGIEDFGEDIGDGVDAVRDRVASWF